VKGCRLVFFVVTSGAAFLTFSGCGESSAPEGATTAEAQPLTEAQRSTQAKPGWITSYEEGQQEAKASHKLVLLDFTGSDWCGWCKLLDKEVFSMPQFQEYAKQNLVLIEVDFPKMKPMSEATRVQNVRLAQRYQVRGFPTIIVLNDDGQKVGELGYMQGGADAFIAVLEKLRKG
jgi:protein disulfide-isomerase